MTLAAYLEQAVHVQNTLPFNATWTSEVTGKLEMADDASKPVQ
jgi:hypothetical protein